VDEQYYNRWVDKNQCVGGCPKYSYCKSGVCICNTEAESVIQIYGQCFSNSTAFFVGDSAKYRLPTPPPRPEYCFCEQRNGGREICDGRNGIDQRGNPECRPPVIIKNFDHNTQYCKRGDHPHCLSKDMNMFCGDRTSYDPSENINKHLCECRKDMTFDTRKMECRLFIDVDCTYETADGYTEGNLAKVMKDQAEPDRDYSPKEIKTAFCNLIDSESAEYVSHIVGEFSFSILGLGLGGFIAVCCITCLTCCCCCKCCEKTRTKIRRLDPRNAMRDAGMGQGAQMAALGAVAAGEYMEKRNDQQDEGRVAAMQGQSMGMPGGAPPGYPQGGPGYPPQGYPPQGYPPQGQQGYIPPTDGGPGIMNMAPELALAGAGAFTGNAAMAGMGVVAAAEKMGFEEDREDRMRVGAMKNVPPPMGYAGGAQPTYPQQELPPATANYPRM